MSELVRTISTGIVGLDIALGGGWRLTRRIADDVRQAATMLIRGGPGTGKSALATDLALRLADRLDGDVLYACVELLPQELIAQRAGFDGFDERSVIDLSTNAVKSSDVLGPTLAVGLQPIEVGLETADPDAEERAVPDVGEMLLHLARIARERGCKPKVVVLDSLIEGYGLGSNASRYLVDGVCKLAIEQGWALILVEEATSERPSPWAFAADTVLSLRLVERDGLHERELSVTKHRFGPCEPGPHRLRIERDRIRVIPPLEAYRNAHKHLVLPKPTPRRALLQHVVTSSFPTELLTPPDAAGMVVAVTAFGTNGIFPDVVGGPAQPETAQLAYSAALFVRFDEQLEESLYAVWSRTAEIDQVRITTLLDDAAPDVARHRLALRVLCRLLAFNGHVILLLGSDNTVEWFPSSERWFACSFERRTDDVVRVHIRGFATGTVDVTYRSTPVSRA